MEPVYLFSRHVLVAGDERRVRFGHGHWEVIPDTSVGATVQDSDSINGVQYQYRRPWSPTMERVRVKPIDDGNYVYTHGIVPEVEYFDHARKASKEAYARGKVRDETKVAELPWRPLRNEYFLDDQWVWLRCESADGDPFMVTGLIHNGVRCDGWVANAPINPDSAKITDLYLGYLPLLYRP